jgi:1-acylglycerol-3-phosphate O-acyltransferase
LRQAIVYSLSTPHEAPPPGTELTTVGELVKYNPGAIILIFPECTTSNGRGILKFSPSLLTATPKTRIYPLNLRYTPADVTTPVARAWVTFLWNLCSKPTNCIRVRIAESVHNPSGKEVSRQDDSNMFEVLQLQPGEGIDNSDLFNGSAPGDGQSGLTAEEGRVLEQVGEALARLGRVKRVNLGVSDKRKFATTWSKHRKVW